MERRCKLATFSPLSSTRTCITRCVDHSGDSSASLRDADMTHLCERVHLACELLTNRKKFSPPRARAASTPQRSHATPATRNTRPTTRTQANTCASVSSSRVITAAILVFLCNSILARGSEQLAWQAVTSSIQATFLKCALSLDGVQPARKNFMTQDRALRTVTIQYWGGYWIRQDFDPSAQSL